jgi:hypothetical protein
MPPHRVIVTQSSMKGTSLQSQVVLPEPVRKAYETPINGISHKALTDTAFDALEADLLRYGSTLSENHRCALYELVGTLTKYAQGTTTGRLAMALPTGMGKTSAIIAWVSSLHKLGLDHISVAVSASKVEALCSIKRDLMAHGVPEEMIGLKHSLGDKASLLSTGNDDRPYMLVTHQRVRGGIEHKLFTMHMEQPRDVMIYDESLFKSDTSAVSERDIRRSLAWLREDVSGKEEEYKSLLEYLGECSERISTSLAALKKSPEDAEDIITLPERTSLELGGYTELLGSRLELEPLKNLLEVSQNPLRLSLTAQDDGVIAYRLVVPEDLKNVLILDASYPVRSLVKMDSTIVEGSKFAKDEELKRFDSLVINQMYSHGGRHSLTESMREKQREKRYISREVAEVIKGVPEDESILIFTFKRRPSDTVDILTTLKDDLRSAGVELMAKTPEGNKRINFLTWGDETSLNSYSHCKNVILAGVLHRSHLDIASVIVGQRDNINADVSHAEIQAALSSEIDHLIYQALSRGHCREVDNGQAKPMKAWIILMDFYLRDRLAKVFPGATWDVWEPRFEGTRSGKTIRLALQIVDYLKSLPETTSKISTQKVKEALGLTEVAPRTFTNAADLIHESSDEWAKEGRSLVRKDFAYYFGDKDKRTSP